VTHLTAYPSDWIQPPPQPAWHRSTALGGAVFLHIALIVLLISLPPAILIEAQRITRSLDVRFYTVSDENAVSDAPLIEPPLSDENQSTNAVPAPVVLDPPDTLSPAEEIETPTSASPEDPALPDETALDTLTSEASLQREAQATGQSGSPSTGRVARSPAPPSSREVLNGTGPVMTTQVSPPPPSTPRRPVSFADILARVDQRLDPADFQIVQALGGVMGTVRESFCLSSSAANLEAGDCPEGPNAQSAELARYGLQGLAEASPEFIEDLSRMEFELLQLGASPSQAQRIMLALQEARRETIETPGVLRAMQRDAANQGDNLGLERSVTPSSAQDPSGEY